MIAPEEPPLPPRMVVVFEANKQKECFELAEEYPEDVLNIGYFNSADPDQATQICATPEQYSKIPQFEYAFRGFQRFQKIFYSSGFCFFSGKKKILIT